MKIEDIILSDNLVPDLDNSELELITKQIQDQYALDDASMEPWRKKYDKAMKLAVMDSDKIEPLLKHGAKLMMPYLMEAALDFNSRVVMEVLSKDEVVWAELQGKPTKEKEERAARVSSYVNSKLKKSNWRTASDKEALILPLVGTVYKKNWIDPIDKKPHSAVIMADKVIFSHDVQEFDLAPQKVELMDKSLDEIVTMERSGLWDVDIESLPENKSTYEIWECHFRHDIDEDGYAEPYIGIYSTDLQKMLRIVPAFSENDVIFNDDGEIVKASTTNYLIQKIIIPDPECKPYGLGFGILLGDLFEAINKASRMLIDAGMLHNMSANSGLIAHGVKPRGNQASQFDSGEMELELGVLKQVQVSGGQSLQQSVMQLPFNGASPTLFSLTQHLEQTARRLSIAGQGIEAQAGEAASMYLAKLNQAMKAPNAMIWRLMQGYEKEFNAIFKMLYDLNDNEDYMNVIDEQADIQADLNYKDCDIVVTTSIAQGSDYERMARAQLVLDNAMQAPQMHNVREAYLQYYEAANVPDIEMILPEPDPNAVDPLQKLQYQYQAMEAEFRDRDMRVKEQKVALEQLKTSHDMRLQVIKLQAELESADATRVETLTKSIKNLAKVADIEEEKAMRRITQLTEQGEIDELRQQMSQLSNEQLMEIAYAE